MNVEADTNGQVEKIATPTPARALFDAALAGVVHAIDLVEETDPNGEPFHILLSHAPFHQGRCGSVRVWTGSGIFRVVACSISAPAIGLDSHMLFAFTHSDCAVPHFTVDSVQTGEHMAFHLDLIPRLDLATHLGYMDWAFGGLTETFSAAATLEGLSPAMITPRQRAVMSPWMLVHRATPQAFAAITPLVQTYLEHWLGLLAQGAPDIVLNGATGSDLVKRDARNKAIIFDPDVDKVWNQIRGLIGHDSVETIRGLLTATSTKT